MTTTDAKAAVSARSPRGEAERLLPALTPQAELALLARVLYREGYDDHLAGHITYRQDDGTLLVNPWELTWDEVRPEDVLRIDLDGKLLEGRWSVTPAIPLHLELHRQREGRWAVHNHSRWGTIYADLRRIPPVFDQTGAGLPDTEIVLYDEYDGDVAQDVNAVAAVAAMGEAGVALLAHHGVFVTGRDRNQILHRCIALEWRCRQGWHVEAVDPATRPMRPEVAARFGGIIDHFGGVPNQFEAMARRELRRDPSLLDAKQQ